MTEPKKVIDWEKVELDYRTGVLSLREIAALHGVSHVAINKRAKKFSWSRDLSAKIKAKAEELVNKALVTRSVTAEAAVNERITVDGVAKRIAEVKQKHQVFNGRLWDNIARLMDEAGAMNENPELYTRLGELMAGDPEVDMLRSAMRRAADFPGRVDANKKLAETMRLAQAMERETYDIAAPATKTEAKVTLDSTKRLHELTDAELHAIATASGAGTADPASGAD